MNWVITFYFFIHLTIYWVYSFPLLLVMNVSIFSFFKGVAVSGAWICLDNYNTIAVEVISVLAQHTSAVIHALQSNMKAVIFEGLELPLKTTGFLCITVDVQCETCSALPANLRVFLRGVATVIPEWSQIAQILLFSYGYKEAGSLALKLTTVYKLCDEIFSSQKHYDFGLYFCLV
ncbi:dynein axonemal heavy chain 12-like [Schistocerca serialis cubense]|uniref:dynein axonemal heavy chain 12-like n=1 Tax=Schistocerca serialis cubense TaxID=2023355 RepID=UPI00214F5427|nr:dynein axonemal heavy chain 12-like [Schistocerca serialis cubense]